METTQTQLEKANEVLAGLSVNVTTSDRTAAKKEWAESTIIQYLKGLGKDLDTAMKLIQFFRKRIEDRDKVLI